MSSGPRFAAAGALCALLLFASACTGSRVDGALGGVAMVLDGTTADAVDGASPEVVDGATDGETTIAYGCTEAGDEGADPMTRGALIYVDRDGRQWSLNDECESPDLLWERSCAGYDPTEEIDPEADLTVKVICECAEGRCLTPPLSVCDDPDPAQLPGSVTYWPWGEESQRATLPTVDVCESSGLSTIRHITCDDGVEQQDVTTCPEGQHCVAGLCGGIACSDTDEGGEPGAQGLVTLVKHDGSGEDAFWLDFCVEDTLHQLGCLDTTDPDVKANIELYQDRMLDEALVQPCGADEICDAGACRPIEPEKTCLFDSDEANDPYVKGYVEYREGGDPHTLTEWDSCAVPTSTVEEDGHVLFAGTVLEGFCVGGAGGEADAGYASCEPGDLCYEGLCGTYPYECLETDGGVDPVQSGYVQLLHATDGAALAVLADACIGGPGGSALDERYCSGGEAYSVAIDCAQGEQCYEGACRRCVEQWAGDNDPYVKNTAVAANGKVHGDFCVGAELQQIGCDPLTGDIFTTAFACPSGQCVGGACL